MILTKSLPGMGGDSRWFSNLNPFEREQTKRQVEFKQQNWPALPDGRFSKRPEFTYPHILPEGDLHKAKAFWSNIASKVLEYFSKEKIALHSEVLNLRSSQGCCLNFLFPFREKLYMAQRALQSHLPGVTEVSRIEFEYTGPLAEQDVVSQWLGEPLSGKRGQNRTSIDAAIFWKNRDGQSCLTLIEWKYTERHYGVCGGHRSRGNKNKAFCLKNLAKPIDAPGNCYLTTGRNTRTYWDNMAMAGIDVEKACIKVQGCPFRGPFNQLLRQFLLAAKLRDMGKFDRVEVISIGFRGNTSLNKVPNYLKTLGETVTEAWNSILLPGIPKLRHTYVEDMLDNLGNQADPDWRDYIRTRYGV